MAEQEQDAQVEIKDTSVLRVDNIEQQMERAYEFTFPLVYNDIFYTGFRFWPSIELTGRVQEMIFDSAYLRTKAWETARAILSRVVKELVAEDGSTQQVAPVPQGNLAYSKPVPRYTTAEKIVNLMHEPDTNMAAFVYQRDFVDEEVEGVYICRSCREEFSEIDNLNDYRIASPKEAILRFLIGLENGSTISEMQDLIKDEDLDAMWNERFQDSLPPVAKFGLTVKKGYQYQGKMCKELKFKILQLHESVQLAKRVMESDKNKPMAATHARLNMMLTDVEGASDALVVTRGGVIKGFGAADYGKMSRILPNAFERMFIAKSRVCSNCSFANSDMPLDMMTFFGMGSSV